MADNAQTGKDTSRRTFLKVGAGVVVGAAIASAVSIPLLTGGKTTVTSTVPPSTVTTTSTVPPSTVTSTVTSTQSASTATTTSTATSVSSPPVAFQFFTSTETALVAALAETIIPTDSNGAGAKEAGVIYFLDGQLAGSYGNNANMYVEGPYVQPGVAGPITVDGITYSGGSAASRLTAGGGYQYPIKWQEFWRNCLQWTEAYSNSVYGANFETLSAANQAQVLTDLWNRKPTNFGVDTQAWFSELHDMVWAGFFTDPLYGGNQGMVGWLLTGFTGTNQGNAYGEGYTSQQLMLSNKPIPLKPQSLAQFQQQVGEA